MSWSVFQALRDAFVKGDVILFFIFLFSYICVYIYIHIRDAFVKGDVILFFYFFIFIYICTYICIYLGCVREGGRDPVCVCACVDFI